MRRGMLDVGVCEVFGVFCFCFMRLFVVARFTKEYIKYKFDTVYM